MINEAMQKEIARIQAIISNTIAKETEHLAHILPKEQSDIIIGFVCASVFANGIALIKTTNLKQDKKEELIHLLYKYCNDLLPRIEKELKEANSTSLYERVLKGEIQSEYKKPKKDL